MTVRIAHFSDILCIWAYVSQIRMEELMAEFGDQVQIDVHLFPVFGDVHGKMQKQWQDRGGIDAYSQHVREVAEQFEHLELHPQVWQAAQPVSSLPAHLHLCAVRLLEDDEVIPPGTCEQFFKSLRQGFFVEARDISRQSVLTELTEKLGVPVDMTQDKINNGQAYAKMAADMQLAKELSVRASPTLIFNDDRQRLAGNVGYKIIRANIRELLERPVDERSWC